VDGLLGNVDLIRYELYSFPDLRWMSIVRENAQQVKTVELISKQSDFIMLNVSDES
jgi:hypothetical protein